MIMNDVIHGEFAITTRICENVPSNFSPLTYMGGQEIDLTVLT